jgi:hypothetical protein
MAKVSTIEFNIEGKDYKFNINVGKEGIFRVNLDSHVANLLGINSKQESKVLKDLEKVIYSALRDFREATKKVSLWISVEYKASGHFFRKKNGDRLEGGYRSKFHKDGFSGDGDALVFDFKILEKTEWTTGTVEWKRMRVIDEETYQNYLKRPDFYGVSDIYTTKADVRLRNDGAEHFFGNQPESFIPYSDDAFRTLQKAREGIRGVSEILFNLVSNGNEHMMNLLNGGNILQEGKE